MDAKYIHEVINHAEPYVRGNVYADNLENYWSLFKRWVNGTYVSVEPFHRFRYLDEKGFRFNNRTDNDAGRFETVTGSNSWSLLDIPRANR